MLREFLALLRLLSCFPISADDDAEISEPVRVFNLNRVSVGGVQCHNFSLLASDVKADLLRKDVESPGLLLDTSGCAIEALYCQHNPGLPGKRRGPT